MKIYYDPTVLANGKYHVYMTVLDKDIPMQDVTINDPFEVLLVDEQSDDFANWKTRLQRKREFVLPIIPGQIPDSRETPLEIEIADDDRLHSLRIERNKQLLATDWAVLPDSPLNETDKQAMLEYRQSLRDVTEPVKQGDVSVEEVSLPEDPLGL